MSQLERIYKLDTMLRRRQPPKKREVLEAFEISPAQLKRDLEFIRDRLGVPITFNAETGAYQYSSGEFSLPASSTTAGTDEAGAVHMHMAYSGTRLAPDKRDPSG